MSKVIGMRVKYGRTGIAAALIVAAALASEAQAPATVAERVRTAMLARESGWQLDDSAVEDQRFWHEWKKRAQRIAIEYTEHPSDADASAWLQALPGTLAMPGEEPLTGVGDEALIWARVTASGKTTIRFRKTRYIAAVTAPSKTIATRIANLVAAQIDE
jgi:hypothetical protein